MDNILEGYKSILNKKGIIILTCRLSPGAKKTEIKEFMSNGDLKIRVLSPPEKGRANLELVSLLAKEFEVALNNVRIKSGSVSKIKIIEIIK
jgi:uncharacterized protein (TIGR00251 family)